MRVAVVDAAEGAAAVDLATLLLLDVAAAFVTTHLGTSRGPTDDYTFSHDRDLISGIFH